MQAGRKGGAYFLFFLWNNKATGGEKMDFKAIALTAGLGAAAGMVAVLAMPKSNPTRKLAAKAADKVEDIAWKVSDTISDKMDMN